MRQDEFNEIKIINEGESLNFEFGKTPDSESASYQDNHDRIRDEVNDNPTSNGAKRSNENKQREKLDKSGKENATKGSSSGGSGASSSGGAVGTTVAAVAGASMIAVSSLSAMVGINLYFNGKCQMNRIEPAATSISYELDLSDINDDQCIIKLENDSFSDSQVLNDGPNRGEFASLKPATAYTVSVIDVTYNNYVFYTDVVSTTAEQRITIRFDANGGSGTMNPVSSMVGESYVLPECSFTYEGMNFAYWTVSGDTQKQYHPGDKVPFDADTVLKANWEKLCTIRFDANGGSGTMSPVSIAISKTYVIPECGFAYQGMDFTYWTVNDDKEKQYRPGDQLSITGDAVLNANWATKQCTIRFVANNGTQETKDPIVLDYDTYFTMPDCPFTAPDAHKMFEGWLLDNDTEPMQGASWYVKGDHVLTASWTDCYVVTYVDEINDITHIDKVPTKDSSYTFLEAWSGTPPTGYYLDSWLDEDENEIDLGESKLLSGDVNVVPEYLSSDTRFVYFDANGGSGSMKRMKATSITPEAPESTFTAPEGFVFDHWTLEDEEPANEYYPGDAVSLAGEESTLVAEWLPDASFTFHIDYLDTQSEEPTNQLHATVTFLDKGEKYVNGEFEIEFVGADGNSITIENVTFEAASKATYVLDLTDYMDFISEYDLLDYNIYGYAMKNDEKVRVNPIRGSVNQASSQKSGFRGIYINGTKVEDGATISYYMRRDHARFPMVLDFSDYNNEYYAGQFYLNEIKIPYEHGMLMFDADEIVNANELTLENRNPYPSEILANYQQLTVTPMATDEAKIFGFTVREASLFNDGGIYMMMSGVGVNSSPDIPDLNASDFRVIFTPKTSKGALTHLGNEVSFEIPFTPNPDDYITQMIFLESEHMNELRGYFIHYPLDVKLVYHDNVADRDVEVTQYTNYTFAYAG